MSLKVSMTRVVDRGAAVTMGPREQPDGSEWV